MLHNWTNFHGRRFDANANDDKSGGVLIELFLDCNSGFHIYEDVNSAVISIHLQDYNLIIFEDPNSTNMDIMQAWKLGAIANKKLKIDKKNKIK